MSFATHVDSPVGRLLLTSDGTHLTGLWLEGQKYFAATADAERVVKDDLPIFGKTRDWLARYFAGEKPDIFALPLAPKGSDFRQAVWKILCGIPYGKTITYGGIARRIGKSGAAQAVGGAVGHNPISIIIPCHRVLGTNGSLTGYAAGLNTKIRLLQLEGVRRFLS